MSDGIKQLATFLLKEGFQFPTVARYTGLSEEEIDQLRLELGISMDELDVPENLFQRIDCEDEHMRARLRSRRMYLADLLSNLETARDRGIAEGIRDAALNLIKKGRPIEKIAEDTGLSIEEIKKLCVN